MTEGAPTGGQVAPGPPVQEGAWIDSGAHVDLIGTITIKQEFDRELESIRDREHRDLGKKGVQEEVSRAYDEHTERYEKAIRDAEHKAQQRATEAEHAVFRTGSSQGYRNAFDRAEGAIWLADSQQEKEQKLSLMLERAERTGDDQQADAIFQLAVEEHIDTVADSYLSRRPDKQKLVDKLADAVEHRTAIERQIGWARSYPLRRPSEASASHWEERTFR
jgi:hypothetical protein